MVEADDVEYDAAENDLLRGGQADSAGVGEIDGDGEESLVNGGELEAMLSVVIDASNPRFAGWQAACSISS